MILIENIQNPTTELTQNTPSLSNSLAHSRGNGFVRVAAKQNVQTLIKPNQNVP